MAWKSKLRQQGFFYIFTKAPSTTSTICLIHWVGPFWTALISLASWKNCAASLSWRAMCRQIGMRAITDRVMNIQHGWLFDRNTPCSWKLAVLETQTIETTALRFLSDSISFVGFDWLTILIQFPCMRLKLMTRNDPPIKGSTLLRMPTDQWERHAECKRFWSAFLCVGTEH